MARPDLKGPPHAFDVGSRSSPVAAGSFYHQGLPDGTGFRGGGVGWQSALEATTLTYLNELVAVDIVQEAQGTPPPKF